MTEERGLNSQEEINLIFSKLGITQNPFHTPWMSPTEAFNVVKKQTNDDEIAQVISEWCTNCTNGRAFLRALRAVLAKKGRSV